MNDVHSIVSIVFCDSKLSLKNFGTTEVSCWGKTCFHFQCRGFEQTLLVSIFSSMGREVEHFSGSKSNIAFYGGTVDLHAWGSILENRVTWWLCYLSWLEHLNFKYISVLFIWSFLCITKESLCFVWMLYIFPAVAGI